MKILRMIGTSQLEAVSKRLTPVIEAWVKDWCYGAHSAEVELVIGRAADCPAAARMEPTSTFGMNFPQGRVVLATAAEGEWFRLVFGGLTPELPQDEVAAALVARARDALLGGIALELACEPARVESIRASHAYAYGSPFVSVRLAFNHVVVDVLVDARLVDDALAPGAAMPGSLVSLSEAVGSSGFPLRVTLPLARISVERLKSLKVGDVLIGEAGLSTKFQLKIDDRQVVAHGYLGRKDNDRALLLDSGN